ncbi:MAG: Ubiquinone/menaquinone biosynthesis C-methyltransferase UbiE [candidate division WS2 bacterium]|nr:Ubiquinone/menaquinone biosynthesis C-methyltransferase UbiE [Candidatus Psychracetigena formicireducens]
MRNIPEEDINNLKNFYISDEYIAKNPSLHVEDSPWKVSKIIPLIDIFIEHSNKDEINLLDVGGGAGLILNAISVYIEKNHKMTVNRFALDLSPGMLKIQKERNPNLKKTLNEDICKTSLADKEIDLTLAIDLLEHVPNPTEALEELKRISKFVIFKVPLEDNLLCRTWNFIRRGKPRQHAIETVGHINVYRYSKLKYEIEKHTGHVLDYYFTNVFDYLRKSEYYNKEMKIRNKLINFVAVNLFKLSPKLCSLIFCDFVMILVKCY